jgi:tRNA dimethylallyltransferase
VTGDANPPDPLGYKQAVGHLRGELSLEDAMESTEIGTRQYAKRQRTWFRRDARIHWLQGFGSDASIQQEADRLLADKLENDRCDSGSSS